MEPQQQRGSLFLLEDTKKVVFKQPFQKILGASPMLNNTLVVLGIKSLKREFVGHYDADGNLLKQHIFEDSNFFYNVIPNDRTIVWPYYDKDFLMQWNLETYQLLEFQFHFENDKCDTHQIFYFPETKLICSAEWGRHDSNMLKFTFFNFPLTKESEPVCTWEAPEDAWNHQYLVKRANSSNKILWFKSGGHKENYQFRQFELVNKGEGKWEPKYTKHEIKNPFKAANGACELSVGYMWEMRPDIFGIVSITDRPHTETDWPNAIFVFETKNNVFRQAKFAMDGKFRFQYIQWHAFGNTFMARAFDWDKGVSLPVPVYYFDNQTETLAAMSTWTCKNLYKFTFPGFDQNMILQQEYQNIDPADITSTFIKVADPKVIVVDFVEKLIPNVDEDLVRAVSELLKEETTVA